MRRLCRRMRWARLPTGQPEALRKCIRTKPTMKLSMKEKITKETTMAAIFRRLGLFLAAALLTLACMPASAWGDGDRDGEYQQTNLVSDRKSTRLNSSHLGI